MWFFFPQSQNILTFFSCIFAVELKRENQENVARPAHQVRLVSLFEHLFTNWLWNVKHMRYDTIRYDPFHLVYMCKQFNGINFRLVYFPFRIERIICLEWSNRMQGYRTSENYKQAIYVYTIHSSIAAFDFFGYCSISLSCWVWNVKNFLLKNANTFFMHFY